MNYFEELNAVNVNDFTETKGKLTYLSWAHAWRELKRRFPKSYYTVYQNDLEWNYFSDNRYCWVKTGVTVVTDDGESLEHIEYLPVMDYKNESIPADAVTSFDVNKAIQRSLTKAVARHGLGLYIYAGEDLPDESDGSAEDRKRTGFAKAITPIQIKTLQGFADELGVDINDILGHLNLSKIEDMTNMQYGVALNKLKKTKDGKQKK